MTPKNFWIASIEVGNGLMVRLSGELDMAGAEDVRRFIETELTKEYVAIRFDCQGVTFIDSIGVKALLRKEQRNREIDEELQGYVEAAVEEKVRRGMRRDSSCLFPGTAREQLQNGLRHPCHKVAVLFLTAHIVPPAPCRALLSIGLAFFFCALKRLSIFSLMIVGG